MRRRSFFLGCLLGYSYVAEAQRNVTLLQNATTTTTTTTATTTRVSTTTTVSTTTAVQIQSLTSSCPSLSCPSCTPYASVGIFAQLQFIACYNCPPVTISNISQPVTSIVSNPSGSGTIEYVAAFQDFAFSPFKAVTAYFYDPGSSSGSPKTLISTQVQQWSALGSPTTATPQTSGNAVIQIVSYLQQVIYAVSLSTYVPSSTVLTIQTGVTIGVPAAPTTLYTVVTLTSTQTITSIITVQQLASSSAPVSTPYTSSPISTSQAVTPTVPNFTPSLGVADANAFLIAISSPGSLNTGSTGSLNTGSTGSLNISSAAAPATATSTTVATTTVTFVSTTIIINASSTFSAAANVSNTTAPLGSPSKSSASGVYTNSSISGSIPLPSANATGTLVGTSVGTSVSTSTFNPTAVPMTFQLYLDSNVSGIDALAVGQDGSGNMIVGGVGTATILNINSTAFLTDSSGNVIYFVPPSTTTKKRRSKRAETNNPLKYGTPPSGAIFRGFSLEGITLKIDSAIGNFTTYFCTNTPNQQPIYVAHSVPNNCYNFTLVTDPPPLPSIVSSASGYTYAGLYQEPTSTASENAPTSSGTNMTVELCAAYCSGYSTFRIENGMLRISISPNSKLTLSRDTLLL